MVVNSSVIQEGLIESILQWDHDGIRKWLADGAEVNPGEDTAHWHRYTPLALAADVNSPRAVEMLLEAGAHPNWMRPSSRQFPLLVALKHNRREVVHLLRQSPRFLDFSPSANYTPLHLIADYFPTSRPVWLIRSLLELGLDVNAGVQHSLPSEYAGATPLHVAVRQSGAETRWSTWTWHDSVVQTLLELGADPNLRDAAGCVPGEESPGGRAGSRRTAPRAPQEQGGLRGLLRRVTGQASAAPSQPLDVPIGTARVRELLEIYRRVPPPDEAVYRPLRARRMRPEGWHDAGMHRGRIHAMMAEGAINGDVALLRTAMCHGGTPDERVRCGTMPVLHLAAQRSRLEAVDYLVSCGANVDARDFCGQTALFHAARYCPWEVLQRLLDAGADPRLGDRHQSTPLHAVARWGWTVEAIHWLLAHGADINARMYVVHPIAPIVWPPGTPPRPGPAYEGRDHLATPLFLACRSGRPHMVETLLAHGADPNLGDRVGYTPLVIAAFYRRLPGAAHIVELLLRHQATCDPQHRNLFQHIPDREEGGQIRRLLGI